MNLTMPLTTWLGLTSQPGDTAGLGPLDAGVCRDLAAVLASNPGSSWCLTLTSPDGHATAHGCATTSPHPPGDRPPNTGPPNTGRPSARWLCGIPLTSLETGTCTHPRQTPAYRPCPALRHLINIRDQTCSFPPCRQQAINCDHDHTILYDQGGPANATSDPLAAHNSAGMPFS